MGDFYITKYKEIIQTVVQEHIPVYNVSEWINKQPDKGIILRHDIDRFVENVYGIAKMEYEYGISSSYYFRINKKVFKPDLIKKVYELGHEVGYHYEELACAKGDYDRAIDLFKRNLNRIREIVPVKTIAMHGHSISPYNNLDLWKHFNLNEFSLNGEAFLSINYDDIVYLTDTGRSWSNRSANIRDRVKSDRKDIEIRTTDELCEFIRSNGSERIALTVHPERWPHSIKGYIKSFLFDHFINSVKRVLLFGRRTDGNE